ncbi:hypothetical protein ACFQ46_17975 [Kineococcus sp. GCM10028916]|uniref:hypothetical protein n=1 Tax=Kineococcus sp. GCM10028916 TaxID=3273394 RepID=UPI003638CED3
MSTRPEEEPGTDEAAESPTLDGYGNDTGFAQEAEEGDESTAPGEPAEEAPDQT